MTISETLGRPKHVFVGGDELCVGAVGADGRESPWHLQQRSDFIVRIKSAEYVGTDWGRDFIALSRKFLAISEDLRRKRRSGLNLILVSTFIILNNQSEDQAHHNARQQDQTRERDHNFLPCSAGALSGHCDFPVLTVELLYTDFGLTQLVGINFAGGELESQLVFSQLAWFGFHNIRLFLWSK